MRLCLICKKRFEKIHIHHISYKYNNTMEVCEKCHKKIHQTKLYPMLKPIDKRLNANYVNTNGKPEKQNLNNAQNVKDMIGNNSTLSLTIEKTPQYKMGDLTLTKKIVRMGEKLILIIPTGLHKYFYPNEVVQITIKKINR